MYDGKMALRLSMELSVDNNEDYQEVKTVEKHIDRLLDLKSWPEIKDVQNVHVERLDEQTPYERLLRVFQDYVSNDYDGCCDAEYVVDSLGAAGVGVDELEPLGFGWLKDLVDTADPDYFE